MIPAEIAYLISASSAVATGKALRKPKSTRSALRQWRPHQMQPELNMLQCSTSSRAATAIFARPPATTTSLPPITTTEVEPEMIEA